MVEWLTTVTDILSDYVIIIAAVLIIVMFVLVKKFRSWRAKKKLNKIKDIKKPLSYLEPSPVSKKTVEKQVNDNPFHSIFQVDTLPLDKSDANVIENIKNLTARMRGDSASLDIDIQNDFGKMHTMLKDVHDRKEQIRFYGLELAKLFEQYRKREFYLTSMMAGMEEVIKLSSHKDKNKGIRK